MDTLSFMQQFFEGLGIKINSLDVQEDAEGIHIDIKTPDSALLIGIHGRNIDSIRHILGRILEKKNGEFTHVHLEVNDYMKQKDERLFRMLDKKIAELRGIGGDMILPPLNAFERKKAHNYISNLEIEGLSTHSEGEKKERRFHLNYAGKIITPSSIALDELPEDGVGI